MGKWEMVPLGDVCTGVVTNIAQKDLTGNNGDYPIYGASGLIKFVDFYRQEKPYIGVVKDGAGVGRVSLMPAKSSVIGTIQNVLPNENVNVNYLYYAMTRMNLARFYTGATIPHIYFKDYKKEFIPLPPLAVQKKIADVLDRAAALIEKRKAQIAKLDLLVKSQFVEMFGDPVANPMGWEVRPLSELLKVVGGYAFSSNGFVDVGIPVLRIGNINTGVFANKNLTFWKYDELLDRYLLRPGDIVITLTGTVGKDDYANVCILGHEHERYYLNQRNAKLELSKDLDKYFLAYILKIPKIKGRLTGISRGIRQANVSNSDILNLSLPIPPIGTQNRFADLVRAVENSKSELQHGLDKLELLYKSLMQKCFACEVQGKNDVF